jgi:membrane-associated protease RseP (regulator of RpoE activity)
LDQDLAPLYGVKTKAFNQAVKRSLKRFPTDFMFRLSVAETSFIRSQTVTGSRRNLRYRPLAFTEQGVAMLAGILKSDRAVEVNIAIMRAFVRMRRLLLANHELAAKLDELENKLIAHDYRIGDIMKAIRKLMRTPDKSKPRIGF